jgi:heat shock protein HtpX
VAATIGAAIGVLTHLFYFGGGRRDEHGHPLAAIGALLSLILAPLAAGLIQAAISRSREFNADKAGAEILGDPMPLATALQKIHSLSRRVPLPVDPALNGLFIAEPLNAVGGVAGLFQTHPPLEQRLLNLIGRESV